MFKGYCDREKKKLNKPKGEERKVTRQKKQQNKKKKQQILHKYLVKHYIRMASKQLNFEAICNERFI